MAAGRPQSSARDAAPGKVIHQSEKEGQVFPRDPAFVEGENERAPLGLQQVVRVLDPFRDALAGKHAADVVGADERVEGVVRDVRVYRHAGVVRVRPSAPAAG